MRAAVRGLRSLVAARVVRPAEAVLALRVLPPRIALFYWRARRRAVRSGDDWARDVAARPGELAALLALARGRRAVVELGTAAGWTAVALALDERARRVTTVDVVAVGERVQYLDLVPLAVRGRIDFVHSDGAAAASGATDPVELLFIDASHSRGETIAEFEAWRPRLADGAVVAFHDYAHPSYPGVAEAVDQLGLHGEVRGGMFVWHAAP